MLNHYTATLLHTIGPYSAAESPPSEPTLSLTDDADGTGFTAELSGYDTGTTNVLYVGQAGGTFTSQGSGWDANQQIEVSADNGHWFGFVESTLRGKMSVSPMAQVTVSGGSSAATDNIPVAKRAMKQTAVYWALSGLDDFGKPEYDEPVEIDCRWDDVQEEFITPNGDREVSRAKLIVDRDLEVKGVVLLSALADVSDSDDPKNNSGAWEIKQFNKTPNFKGTKYLREVYL